MGKYTDYVMKIAQDLLAVPSPSGFTHMAAEFVKKEFENLGYKPQITQKGAVLVKLGGKDDKNAVVLAAHMDTLGGMVCQIMDNGHLKLTNIGGMNPNNAEAENCKVYTKSGKVYDATFQLENASVHVNGEYSDTKRTYETMEAILDEPVKNKEDVKKLGIMTGDFVCFDPRTVVTESGYIKSRFLDDKFSTAILLGYAKYLKEKEIQTERTIYVLITSYEEVGHGGCAAIPDGVTEMISVDMGCVGKGLECDETMVSICAKDSMGPYDYQVVSGLIKAAQENDIAFAVDVYPHYGSDVDAALKAGYDRTGSLRISWIRAVTQGWSEEYTEITEGIFRIKVLRGSAKGAEQSTFIWGDVCAGRHVRLEEKID